MSQHAYPDSFPKRLVDVAIVADHRIARARTFQPPPDLPDSGPMESEGIQMLAKSLKDYLDQKKIKYLTITHSRAFTAQEVAECAHIPGNMLAKTVMIEIDGKMAMAVVPANHRVRLDDLRGITHTSDVRLMHEDEFRHHFPDCEAGAVPPFGHLYDIPVYMAPELSAEGEIAFNAGSHTETIKMSWKDFDRLVKPRVAKFAT